MKIALPKEIKSGEYRVAMIPSNVAKLVDAGHTVYVEKDAGAAAGYPDEEYVAAGAEIVATEKDCFDKAEMVVKVKEILPEEFGLLKEDQILFTYIHSSTRRAMTEEILGSKCIGFAMEDRNDFRKYGNIRVRYDTLDIDDGYLTADIPTREKLMRALVELGREQNREGADVPSHVPPKDGKILEILRYIDENLTSDISIDDLAGRFYISKYHMMRRFREESGISIHTYLSDKRLLLARDLIKDGASATEACFNCGFKSYSAFSRAYGKFFGVTPTGRGVTEAVLPDNMDMTE